MTFEDILKQTIDILQSRERVSYRALKRQFDLSDDYLEDLKDEILYAYPQVVEDGSRGLTWPVGAAETAPPPTTPPVVDHHDRLPAGVYTPQHLVEKIFTSHAALEGENKQVTVLFCDLANSTGLAEALGPELMHTVLNQFFELALNAVHRYEGTINQFLGDGFMALFGAPIAHEDHARRAVLAALELRRQLLVYNASQGRAEGVELALSMGLNTGLVVVGAIGDNLRMDYTAVGDTTNVAARLEQEASSNQIIISDATYRLVEGYCTCQPLGALALKGKSEPMEAWEVLAAGEHRTRLDVGAARGLTPFVARSRELRLLHECIDQVQAGHGQVVFLVGEAGIGKSRLLLELRRQLSELNVAWLEGNALSFGQSMALHPLIELLKHNFQIEEQDTEHTVISKIEESVLRLGEDLRPTLPYIRRLLAVDPGDADVANMDPQLRRAEVFEAGRRILLRAAEDRLQILVFEDLHWIDNATEGFLRTLLDSVATSRVLCLLTYRPGYIHPFGDRTYHTRLVLQNLSGQDSATMAQAALDASGLPNELETLITDKAEGNPFFIEEVVRSLLEIGAIQRLDDHYVLAQPIEDIVVPDTIQDILMARIDRLAEAPKQILQLASVIGREFTHRLLDRLTEIQAQIETCLQDLKTIELIYETSSVPEVAYMFKHALTQDVAYHSLLSQRRQQLHQLVGRAIEELYADRLSEQYEVLAYHAAKGQEWDKALDYFRQAAEKATQAFANREALSLLGQAQEAATEIGASVDVATLMAIHQAKANLYFALSDFNRARQEGEHALKLARQAGDRASEAGALVSMGLSSTYAHDFEQALVDSRQAIEIAQAVDIQPAIAGARFTIGAVYAFTGEFEQARQELDQAVQISKSVGDVVSQSLIINFFGNLKNWEGYYTEALELTSESLALARRNSLLFPLLLNLFTHGLILTGKGDYDAGLGVFQEGFALAEKVGEEFWGLRFLNCMGWVYSECGNLERAIELNQRSAEEAHARSEAETIANAELNLADIFLAKGDLVLAQEFLEGIHRLVRNPATSDWMQWRYATHLFASLGELKLAQGDAIRAREHIDQCLEIATRTHAQKYLIKGWRIRGQIALKLGQRDDAESWVRQALTLAQTVGNPTQLWQTHLAMGHVHATGQQGGHARQSYRAAREVIDRLQAGLESADLREHTARSLLVQEVYELSC